MATDDELEAIRTRYREMAKDARREERAEEWCEGLIGDAEETADSSLRSE